MRYREHLRLETRLAARLAAALMTAVLLVACGGATSPASAPPPAASAAASSSGAALAKASAPAVGSSAAGSGVAPLSPTAKVRIAVNAQNIAYLPIFYAIDQGSFAKAGLDVSVTKFAGSSTTQLPLLARGDLDIAPVVPAPALYNQASQGFDIRIIASNGVEKQGRLSSSWLTVVKSQEGQIKTLQDLKGKTIDGAAEGSPLNLLALEAIQQAGLTPGKDVTLQFRAKTPADMLVLAKDKGADVIGMIEPLATQGAQQGLAVKWKDFADIIPWYQPSQIAASKSFLSKNPAAVEKFLEVYIATCREINTTQGKWSDDLIKTATKWAGVKPEVITDQGGVPYFDPNATVSIESLQKTQDTWFDQKQIKQKVDVQQLIDAQPARDAVSHLGGAN